MNRLPAPGGAAALYLIAALALTWPLATALGSALPWDMGDPVLNTWILGWGAAHVHRLLGGDLGAYASWWNAGIFHPSPLALAYSEHLFAQALQVWPVYAATGNPVLCYNLVFLSTFVLSGLGMFLLVREVTGSRTAAFVAGLLFAFTPYRLAQASHVQVLSAQWMPFILYALRRHVASGSMGTLAGAAGALVAQNLSCGYYMIFFAPVAAAYALFEVHRSRRWTDRRLLSRLAALAIVVAVCTWPFVRPYLILRETEFPAREVAELRTFSADLEGYAAADGRLWLWGDRLRGFRRTQEGVVFQGVIPMSLAALTALMFAADAARTFGWRTLPAWRRFGAAAAALFAAANIAAVAAVAVHGPIVQRIYGASVRVSRPGAALLRGVIAICVVLWLLPALRTWVVKASRTDTAFYLALTLAAAILSFGPSISSGGFITIPSAPYEWLYQHVPGFDGLRVPARFAMIVAFGLAVLAGIGLAEMERGWRWGSQAAAVAGAVFLMEASAAPILLNGPLPSRHEGIATPSGPLYQAGDIPPVYRRMAEIEPRAVLVEFPIGVTGWDVRYMFYALFHEHRLVNGFSGGVPVRYAGDLAGLSRTSSDPELAWSRLIRTGAAHAIVHLDAYEDPAGESLVEWLKTRGAREIGRFGRDVLFELKPRTL